MFNSFISLVLDYILQIYKIMYEGQESATISALGTSLPSMPCIKVYPFQIQKPILLDKTAQAKKQQELQSALELFFI